MKSEVPNWKFRQARVKYPVPNRIEIREDEPLELFELEPEERFSIGDIEFAADAEGKFRIIFMASDEFRCHLGILNVKSRNDSSFEVNILPGKLTQREFEILKNDLQSMWSGIILDSEGITSVQAMREQNLAYFLWDNRARRALQSLLAVPPTQLQSRTTLVPISRVRQLGTPDVRMVLAKERGLPLQAIAPTPTILSKELYFVRDTLIRLRSLAKRQLGLCEAGTVQYSELSETIQSISRFLEHPTLDVPVARCLPTHLMKTDRRLNIFLKIRSSLSQLDAPIIIGPGDLKLGIKGIDRIYEIWVFFKILQGAIAHYGEPLSGLEELATQSRHGKLDLNIEDGAEVLFSGDIRICFTPSIYINPLWSWENLNFVPNPAFEERPTKATPDVMILGPDADALVIDAKYRARHFIDSATVEVHAKYSRFKRNGYGVVAHVMGAHPHADISFSYAGYSAQPFVPGLPLPQIPWPQPHREVIGVVSEEITMLNDVHVLSPEREDTSISPAIEQPHKPTIPVTHVSPTATPIDIRLGNSPDVAILDLAWLFDVMKNRKVDFARLSKMCQVGKGCSGYIATINKHKDGTFVSFAKQSGWNVILGENRYDLLKATRTLITEKLPEEIIMISSSQDFLDISQDFLLKVETLRDPNKFPWMR